MEKWEIRSAPTRFDPRRHVLLLQGDKKEVAKLLKSFGALCGRPVSVQDPAGYNISLPLHNLTEASMGQVKAFLDKMLPAPVEQPQALAPAPVELPPPPIPTPTPAPAPTEESSVSRASAAPRDWRVSVPIDPLLNFDSLLVGPFNRFAHAAAASVVGAPGSMYNPLFLHGPPGVGKTHMLHAIGTGLGQTLGPEAVVLTSACLLARAAGPDGRPREIEALIAKAQALLVDDIHLLSLSDQNKPALDKIFSHFFGKNLQVVFTSIYPPKALSALEEALKISFGRGWSVDLKVPSVASQEDIIQGFLDRHSMQLPSDSVKVFQDKLGPNFSDIRRWLRRFAALAVATQSPRPEDLIAPLFELGLTEGNQDLPSKAQLAAAAGVPFPQGGAIRLAWFLPKGQEEMGSWMAQRLQESGIKFGIKASYHSVFHDFYDPEKPFGLPFEIAEKCREASAQAALFMGPSSESGLASQEGEFSHAVGHVLESFGVSLGWIGHRGTMSLSNFLRLHLDFLSRPLL